MSMGLMTGICGRLAASAVGLLVAGVPLQPATPAPLSALPLRLTGLIVDKDTPARSACLIRCADAAGRGGMFFAGQPACDLAEIQEIREDGVLIKNLVMNRPELLMFPDAMHPAGAKAPFPDTVPVALPEAVTVGLPKGAVVRYLNDLPGLLGSAVATPRYRDDAGGQRSIDGYEIGQIRAGGAAEQLGLRNGDVVLEVNGQPLDGMATVMRLFGQLQAMPQTNVVVLRNGHRMTFVLDTKRDDS
jgi:type II secretory pathway component PulC